VDPDVPGNADAIVMKALTKDRDSRYQTADEMRADGLEASFRGLDSRPLDAARLGTSPALEPDAAAFGPTRLEVAACAGPRRRAYLPPPR
jgi:serine/threonine-protein kinase